MLPRRNQKFSHNADIRGNQIYSTSDFRQTVLSRFRVDCLISIRESSVATRSNYDTRESVTEVPMFPRSCRYSAAMPHRTAHSPLASLLLMLSVLPCAWAQTGIAPRGNDIPATGRIVIAHGAYSQRDDLADRSGDGQALSEFAQRRPLISPNVRYSRPRYATMWRQRGNGRHALIGALIGFGVGAAIGAKANKDPNARVSAPVLFGGFGALIGAGIGASHP
jgi:hypothetical protein